MDKRISYNKTLESKIIGSQYEIAPSVHKYSLENHKMSTRNKVRDMYQKNMAEEMALKEEQIFIDLLDMKHKMNEAREKNLKEIMRQKIKTTREEKYKESIENLNRKSFSKEKKIKYNELQRKKVIDKFSNNRISNYPQVNNEGMILNQNEANQKELFYHTIRVYGDGNVKSNMLINEYDYNMNEENFKIENYDYKTESNNIQNINSEEKIFDDDKIKIKYEESINNNIDFDSNNIIIPQYKLEYNENRIFQNYDRDENNNFNNFNYNGNFYNDSFNIFKENQSFLNTPTNPIIVDQPNNLNYIYDQNNPSVIIEVNENEENCSDKTDNFMSQIIEKNKELQINKNRLSSSNIINLREDIMSKVKAKMKENEIIHIKKNPFLKNINSNININSNYTNETNKIKEYLANSRLTFGDNFNQDGYYKCSNNSVWRYGENNISNITTNLQNKNFFRERYSGYSKSFDTTKLSSQNKNTMEKTPKQKDIDVDINEILDKNINKVKTFRRTANYSQDNLYKGLDDNNDTNDNNYVTENSSAFSNINQYENHEFNFNINNTTFKSHKGQLTRKPSLMEYSSKNSFNKSLSKNKTIIKR